MRPRLLVFLTSALSVLLYLFGANSNAAAQGESEKARAEVKLGVQAYNSGQFEQAAEHFRNAIRLDENLAVAKLDLANTYGALWAVAYIYFGAHRFEDSREYLKRLIEVNPDNAAAYYTVAVVDWAAADQDVTRRRNKFNLKTPGYEKQPASPQGLCEQVKTAKGPTIAEGLKMTQAAMKKRDGYREAMVYGVCSIISKPLPNAIRRLIMRVITHQRGLSRNKLPRHPTNPLQIKNKPLAENEVPSFFVFPPAPPPRTHRGRLLPE